ncbi:MAG: hypothetical protein RL363_1186 [Bacteroidota bacterium]|jgi:hypothetical protein
MNKAAILALKSIFLGILRNVVPYKNIRNEARNIR